MKKTLKALFLEEDGATMVEYALMIALIAAAVITSVNTLKTAVSGRFTSVATSVTSAS